MLAAFRCSERRVYDDRSQLERTIILQLVYTLSLVLGAVVLVPSGAHVLEMPHKLLMPRDAYFITQQVYQGWALFGIPIVVKIVLDAAIGLRIRRMHPAAGYAAFASAAFIACGLLIFFVFVQPGNAATANWTVQVANWQELRRNWEYGHAGIAALTFLAFVAMSFGVGRLPMRSGAGLSDG